ncbi:MAG: EAL domain-containing protein [Dehalococcoidia bacterium]
MIRVATLFALTFSACFILWPLGKESRALLSDVAYLPLSFLSTVYAWRASRHPGLDRRTRLAWRFISLGLGSFWAGDVAYFYINSVRGWDSFPSVADAGYLGLYPLLAAGLLCFPAAPRTRTERIKLGLDAAMMLLGSGALIWYAILRPTPLNPNDGWLGMAVSAAYPPADLVVIVGLVSVVLRRPLESSRRALALLSLGAFWFVVADLLYLRLTLAGTYQSGDPLDAIWMCAQVLFVMSAHVQMRHAGAEPAAGRAALPGIRSLGPLPYVFVAVGYGLVVLAARESWTPVLAVLITVTGALTALVVARQFTALREIAGLLQVRGAREYEARFTALVQHSTDVIMVVTVDGDVRYHTPSLRAVLGYAADDLAAVTLFDLLHRADTEHARRYLAEAALRPGSRPPVEWRVHRKDDSWVQMEAVGLNLLREPTVAGLVVTMRDISERKALEHELRHQAFHDPLTGLANRVLFRERVDFALARSIRNNDSLAVFFIDLDGFKMINDSLGHAIGDALLVAVAERLADRLGADHLIARLGGDEFALLVEELPGAADAEALAVDLLAALRAPFTVGADGLADREVSISASIGVAFRDGARETTEALLRNADLAMYQAKARGKGRYAVYEPAMYSTVVERLELEAALRQALSHDEFRVHYQPCIDLASGRITGAEALLRWQHPSRGLVSPATFVPLAEDTGLIVPIGRWVLEQACRQAVAWQQRFPHAAAMTMSVNLSGRQLQQPELVDEVLAILHATGMALAGLVLEVTESVMMQDAEASIHRLRRLKDIGVRLAVDDFGTGYSSLSYLQRFPVDILKVDKSFVDALDDGNGEDSLVSTIIQLGANLHLKTVAEGTSAPSRRDGCNRSAATWARATTSPVR